jgi:hypothetical protein
MIFQLDSWYETNDGFYVKFIKHRILDGMYNVFRHTEQNENARYYTDDFGLTSYGSKIVRKLENDEVLSRNLT